MELLPCLVHILLRREDLPRRPQCGGLVRSRAAELRPGLEIAIERTATRSRSWVTWALAGGAVSLTAVIVAVILYLTVFTVGVKLDGRAVRLRSGSTVGDIFSAKLVDRHSGDLVAAKDRRVLQRGGGGSAYVEEDGRVLASGDPLPPLAQLTSYNGTDTVEQTRMATEVVEIPIRYEGTGPLETVVTSGSPGVRQLTVGVVSGQVVAKRVTVPAVARVVRRTPLFTGAKTVALTFDDGPWPGSTVAILKILQQNGVKATFFEIGRQARQMPSLSRQVANAGMEMGNHSESHPLNIGHLSAVGVANQITQAQYDIKRASGKAPLFFRPPGGNTTPAMYPVLTKLKLGWVQWDIDTDDWKRPSAGNIVSKVLRNVTPGSVVLMHDGGGDRSHTVAALPAIIKGLKAQGYVFVTVSALQSVPHRMG